MENGVTHDNLTKNDVKVVVPLKHVSNFWRHLDIPLINCEVELILAWFKICVLIDKSTREANYDADPNVYEIYNPENDIFNRYKIECSSCYFIKRRLYEAFRTIKIRI